MPSGTVFHVPSVHCRENVLFTCNILHGKDMQNNVFHRIPTLYIIRENVLRVCSESQ